MVLCLSRACPTQCFGHCKPAGEFVQKRHAHLGAAVASGIATAAHLQRNLLAPGVADAELHLCFGGADALILAADRIALLPAPLQAGGEGNFMIDGEADGGVDEEQVTGVDALAANVAGGVVAIAGGQ